MTKKEAIEQLESLKIHCKDFVENDPYEDCIWKDDIEALDLAINSIIDLEFYREMYYKKAFPEEEIRIKGLGVD